MNLGKTLVSQLKEAYDSKKENDKNNDDEKGKSK